MSLCAPDRNVSIKPSCRGAVGMCEITAPGDFQGLWEEWDGFIVPRFPSDRHFHRRRRHDFRFIVGPVKLPASLLIAELLAVGPYLRLMLDVLLCLHHRECMAQPLVLDDCCMADTLVLAEDAIGK